MDITKKLYILAIVLIGLLGFFAYRQYDVTLPPDDSALKNAQLSQSVRNIIKGKDGESSNSFLGQVPEMRVADKYRAVKEEENKTFSLKRQSGTHKIAVNLDGDAAVKSDLRQRKERLNDVKEALSKLQDIPVPPLPDGFFSDTAAPYILYRETLPLTDDFKGLILRMHSSLLKMVTPFSLITEVKRIFMMMFKTRENYALYSKLPDWSGGATYVFEQSIYIMENRNFKSTFMHELTHIYFDGFFKPSPAPRWLSEGFAVYVQSLYQTPAENEWLNKFRLKFVREEYIDFDDFTQVPTLVGYEEQEVAMWYAQAYSVVKFLFERYGKDDFYQFSKNLKDGMPLGRAMFRSYGMPLNNVSALESAWQANLRKNLKAGRYE